MGGNATAGDVTASPAQTGTGGAGTGVGGAAAANGGGATSGAATVNNTATVGQGLTFNLSGLTITVTFS
jgi:hypothetical protein